MGGSAKNPCRRQHLEERFTRREANSSNMASKCGPRRPHWLMARAISRRVADNCLGFAFLTYVVNFPSSACCNMQSELVDEWCKQVFDREREIMVSIAAFFA